MQTNHATLPMTILIQYLQQINKNKQQQKKKNISYAILNRVWCQVWLCGKANGYGTKNHLQVSA